uniref:Uncharacterized protein n=1 Tax=Pseudomonas phage RVTF4 TaxID=3236931 RepID=A0AB39CCV2_9VIRU
MNTILIIIALVVTAALVNAAIKYVRNLRASYRLEQDAHQILTRIIQFHPEFFKINEEPFISTTMLIELEFYKLPAYRHAFARMNVALEEADRRMQEDGFSHVLNYCGNQVGVKNFVDITHTAIRTA